MNVQNHKENVDKGCFCSTAPQILFIGVLFTNSSSSEAHMLFP